MVICSFCTNICVCKLQNPNKKSTRKRTQTWTNMKHKMTLHTMAPQWKLILGEWSHMKAHERLIFCHKHENQNEPKMAPHFNFRKDQIYLFYLYYITHLMLFIKYSLSVFILYNPLNISFFHFVSYYSLINMYSATPILIQYTDTWKKKKKKFFILF